MRDYGKVYATFWSSETTGGMSDDGKLLALYLMTCSHSTIAGVFRLPDGYVSEDLGWPLERVSEGFAELFRKGFANRCETTKWVWVRKHLEWNKPENPNQRKAAAKVVCSVPDQCAWKRDFWRDAGEVLALEPLPEPNPYETVPQTLFEPFRNQKQEQKQEQEQKKPTATSAAKLPTCPTQDLIDLYHEILPDLPRVRLHTKDRTRALQKTWAWCLTSKRGDGSNRAESAEQAVQWFRDYFTRAGQNDFLMGRTPRSGEHANWRCDLDFLLTDRGMKHVIEKTLDPA